MYKKALWTQVLMKCHQHPCGLDMFGLPLWISSLSSCTLHCTWWGWSVRLWSASLVVFGIPAGWLLRNISGRLVGESKNSVGSLPTGWDFLSWLPPPQRLPLLLGDLLHLPFSLDSGDFMNGCGFLLLPALGLFYIILCGFLTHCPHLCE